MLIRYDWQAIQQYYDSGHTMRECQEHFGFATQAWDKAIQRGAIKSRPQTKPIEYYLVLGRRCNTSHLKRRLISEGLLKSECYKCGITDWLGELLVLQLDHKNGNELDNRLENLWILCPNCHSQTPTYGSKNWRLNPKIRYE